MFRFDDEMKRLVLEQRLGYVATVDADGQPNLSPKGTTTLFDESRLMFADIRSPATVDNLRRNSAIEVNVVDPLVRRGYRFRGQAQLHSRGTLYEQGLRLLAERGYDTRPRAVRTVVVVQVDQATPLISPAYDSGADTDQVARPWRQRMLALLLSQDATRPPTAAEVMVRRFHEAQAHFYGGGPIDPLLPFLADGVSWHVPGRSAIAGDYHGRVEVCAYFERRRERARATFQLEVREVVSAGDLVFQLVGGTVEQARRRRSWETVGVLRVTDGVIRDCRLLPFDQYLFDQIWS